MSMSRMHYREVAEILSAERPTTDRPYSTGDVGDMLERIASGMARMFREDNSNFSREKFMDAVFPEVPVVRPLRVIAMDIRANWGKPYFGAVPYIEAMTEIDKIDDLYYADRAADIVRYFLANAGTWRGETARRVKAELKALLA